MRALQNRNLTPGLTRRALIVGGRIHVSKNGGWKAGECDLSPREYVAVDAPVEPHNLVRSTGEARSDCRPRSPAIHGHQGLEPVVAGFRRRDVRAARGGPRSQVAQETGLHQGKVAPQEEVE